MRAILYILIGILLIAFGAYNLYGGYELDNPTFASFGFGSIVIGAIVTLFGFSHRNTASTDDKTMLDEIESVIPKSEEEENGEIEIRALIQAMGVVAVADRQIRQEEVTEIANIYEEMLGLKIQDKEIRKILSEFDDHFDFEENLVRNRSHISPTMKRVIIQSCQKVMVSDLEIVRSEQNRIMEIGRALGFSDPQTETIINTTKAS